MEAATVASLDRGDLDLLSSLDDYDYSDAILSTSSSTSIVAEDMEVMLRKFVRETSRGRRELLQVARSYYDQLDIQFPNVSRPCAVCLCKYFLACHELLPLMPFSALLGVLPP